MNQGLGGATPEAAGRDVGCEGEEWLGMGVARQTSAGHTGPHRFDLFGQR